MQHRDPITYTGTPLQGISVLPVPVPNERQRLAVQVRHDTLGLQVCSNCNGTSSD